MKRWMTRHANVWIVAGLLLLVGCAEQPRVRRAMAPAYKPSNQHSEAPLLPESLRRIAVLPLTAPHGDEAAASVLSHFESLLLVELRKKAAFDVVPVTREQIKEWSGRADWRQDEPLPTNFLSRIREQSGSDGILFAHLSAFRAYPPLAAGWRLSLVDGSTGKAFWSVDEVFDAGSVEVIKSAQAYSRSQMNQPALELDSTGVLTSPSRFGQYSAAAVLGTLPHR